MPNVVRNIDTDRKCEVISRRRLIELNKISDIISIAVGFIDFYSDIVNRQRSFKNLKIQNSERKPVLVKKNMLRKTFY